MSTTRNVAIGLGIVGGALLAAWLLTGDRKKKTKDFILKSVGDLKKTFQKKTSSDETDVHYV